MRSEIIFSYNAEWYGRWGNAEGKEIVIASSFDNPVKWPFTLKRTERHDDDDFNEIIDSEETVNLPKALFDRIKRIIAEHGELVFCESDIENAVMDGTSEAYSFLCDDFSFKCYGSSIMSVGSYEANRTPDKRTDNYTVYTAVKAIEEALASADISLW